MRGFRPGINAAYNSETSHLDQPRSANKADGLSGMGGLRALPTWIFATASIILAVGTIWGIFVSGQFLILGSHKLFAKDGSSVEWLSNPGPLVWICSVLLVLIILGVVRYLATFVARIARAALKFAQNDVVTVILAVVINAALLVVNVWMTTQLMSWVSTSGVKNVILTSMPFLGAVGVFMMFATAMIWIPRLGLYGENRLGQFDGDNPER